MALKLHQDELPTINLTSMIDILFLLIIFFMVGTHFGEEEQQIKMNLAQSQSGEAVMSGPDFKIINITAQETVVMDGDEMGSDDRSLQGLTGKLSELRASYPKLRFTVRPHEDSRAKTIARVADAAARSGAISYGMQINRTTR